MTPRPALRSLCALAIALLAAGAALVAGASSAQAHDVLVSTDPADGSTVTVAPDHVTLTFAEPAQQLGTELRVLDEEGRPVGVGEPKLVDTTVTQHLADGRPAGTYTVTWRVTSQDGHPVSGTFTFTAKRATGPVAAAPTVTPTEAAPAPTETPAALPTATPAKAQDPHAWGTGDNHVRAPLVGFLLLLLAVGVGTATWLVARER